MRIIDANLIIYFASPGFEWLNKVIGRLHSRCNGFGS